MKHIKPGMQFGRLTVLQFDRKENGNRYWLVECSCDKQTQLTVPTNQLNASRVRSCGCLVRDRMAKLNRLPGNQAAKNRLLSTYKKSATRRKLVFKLTAKQFFNLTQDKCCYCGREPLTSTKTIAPNCPEDYFYNGIDRRDNSKGYTISNSVTCCGQCNLAKNTQSHNEFMEYLLRITKHIGQNN